MSDRSLSITSTSCDAIVAIVLDRVSSVRTKRACQRALQHFLTWYSTTRQLSLTKATAQRYAAVLAGQYLSATNINQRLSAICRLVTEAKDNGAMPEQIANGIQNVKGIRLERATTGNWLDKEQAQKLISAPDTEVPKGLRDRAILAVLIGCGLRREEAARLTLDHTRRLDGRWAIVDLMGKRSKTRSVPVPSWAKAAIDEWTIAADIKASHVFGAINRGDKLAGDSISAQAIRDIVVSHAEQSGLGEIAPHD